MPTAQENFKRWTRTFSSSPSFMFKASRRAPADRDTDATRAVVEVGVLCSQRDPNPHGADRPTGAPTNAALFDAWPAHGLAVATPAVTASRAQVLIMMQAGGEG